MYTKKDLKLKHGVCYGEGADEFSDGINGSTELYIYECPCGNGTIREEHDNTPGFREHIVWINCDNCSKKFKIDKSEGVRNWSLIDYE